MCRLNAKCAWTGTRTVCSCAAMARVNSVRNRSQCAQCAGVSWRKKSFSLTDSCDHYLASRKHTHSSGPHALHKYFIITFSFERCLYNSTVCVLIPPHAIGVVVTDRLSCLYHSKVCNPFILYQICVITNQMFE